MTSEIARREASGASSDDPVILDRWSARKLHPVVLLYVALVFLFCMALASFVFHSTPAVKALGVTGLGSLGALVPSVIGRNEYRMTSAGLEQRPLQKEPGPFRDVVHWDQLSHVVPMRHGFKFYKPLEASSPLRRFWRAHLASAFSGEVHLEREDRDRVLTILADRGIPTSKPSRRP